jgi:hypothetical protein
MGAMSVGGRGQARQQMLRRGVMITAALVVLALLFLVTGHLILAIVFGVVAAAAVWALRQARSVR